MSTGLTGPLPAWLNTLTNLIYVDVSYNALTGPLPDLSQLHRLNWLNIFGNQFTGEIPAWIGDNLTALQVLYLGATSSPAPFPTISRN